MKESLQSDFLHPKILATKKDNTLLFKKNNLFDLCRFYQEVCILPSKIIFLRGNVNCSDLFKSITSPRGQSQIIIRCLILL